MTVGVGASVAAQPSARRVSRNGALLVASFGALLAFLDATIVNVAFPSIRQSFPDSSIGSLSWVLNSYNIVFAAFLVASGRFADLFGRRRVFTAGVVLFTVASVLCAVAPSLGLLIAARAVQAAGAASQRSRPNGAHTPSACGVRPRRRPPVSARRWGEHWWRRTTGG